MQTFDDRLWDSEEWDPEDSTATLAAESEARAEPLLDYSASERVRDVAVKLCMLACGDAYCLALHRCPSKAVELYDDAEVRESIIRAFGEVSRSEFEALCAEAYTGREMLVGSIIIPKRI
jgi:hypothetical protein